MRALTLTSFAGLDGVVLAEVPEPEVSDDAVVVRVHASALGPWDIATTEGLFVAAGGLATFPQTLGWDFAGIITAVGSAVPEWAPGDRVLGFSPQPWSGIGVVADSVAMPPSLLSALPPGLDFVAGAALPVTALTAKLAVQTAAVGAGTAALVIGAAGAVGGCVLELGRDLGAHMIASVSAGDFDAVRHLGASDCVDRAGDVAAQVRQLAPDGVQATIDLVGPAVWDAAMAATADGGRFVTTSPMGLPDSVRDITTVAIGVQPDPESLAALAQRCASGSLTSRVAAVTPLADARVALEAVRNGQGRGKQVLDLGR